MKFAIDDSIEMMLSDHSHHIDDETRSFYALFEIPRYAISTGNRGLTGREQQADWYIVLLKSGLK